MHHALRAKRVPAGAWRETPKRSCTSVDGWTTQNKTPHACASFLRKRTIFQKIIHYL
jgi:hypothetical protein